LSPKADLPIDRQSAILAVELRASDPMTTNSSAIEQLNTLSPAHQQQVVDFIAFLKAREQVKAAQPIAEAPTGDDHSRLQRKQGVLVIDTGGDSEFDINAFIGEMREERIQDQIGQVHP
jgi:hypothetical protein